MVFEDRPGTGDLAERLLDRRMVLVSGPLDLQRATDACARIMLLDGSGDDAIDVVMSCPDGELDAALALADTIELVGVELRTICSGAVGGAAVLPFTVASRRLAQPHASFRLSEPRLEGSGTTSDLVREAEHHAAVLEDLRRRLAAATGQPESVVADDLRRGRMLSAADARRYGLVDEIVRRNGLRGV